MVADDYKFFVRAYDKFRRCLLYCANEICRISKGRELEGDWNEDVEEWDSKRYYVVCESYSCGETNYDGVYVPIRYMYDEEYREEYRKILINEKERVVSMVKEREEARKVRIKTYRLVTDDRAEYERLKKKFEV